MATASARLSERREALVQKRSAEVARQTALETEAASLATRLATCEAGAHTTIERRVAELHEQRHHSESRRHELDAHLTSVDLAIGRLDAAKSIITTIDAAWPRLTPAGRGRLVRSLIERVEVSPEGHVRIELVSSGMTNTHAEESREAA